MWVRSPLQWPTWPRRCSVVWSVFLLTVTNACWPATTTPSVLRPPTGPGLPDLPELVTVVPFQLYYGFILLQAEVDGHHGTFLLDTGSPLITLNSQYLQRDPHGNPDTVAATTPATDHKREEVTIHTLRIGTLFLHLDTADLGSPERNYRTNALIMTDSRMQQFGRPLLGWLGLPAMAPFETIIDYTHQRLILIRLDVAGHRLATVPLFTPAMTVPLVSDPGIPFSSPFGMLRTAKGDHWAVVGQVGGIGVDTLLLDTGAPYNSMPGIGKLASHVTPAGVDATRMFNEGVDQIAKNSGVPVTGPRSLVVLDHLTVAGITFDTLPMTSLESENLMIGVLGYPFLSRRGTVGFNFRLHQLAFYQ
jgi:hypothetical protein